MMNQDSLALVDRLTQSPLARATTVTAAAQGVACRSQRQHRPTAHLPMRWRVPASAKEAAASQCVAMQHALPYGVH
jgi:hypothetical protein